MYEVYRLGPRNWAVSEPPKPDNFCVISYHATKQTAEKHAAYMNTKAIQKATERAARNKHRIRKRANTKRRNRTYVHRRTKQFPHMDRRRTDKKQKVETSRGLPYQSRSE